MASAQSMLKTARVLAVVACALGATIAGCGPKRGQLYPPTVLVAPYDTSAGEVLWAVIPPRNESGTSIVDEHAVGDAIVAAVQGVRGIRCLPINRTLEAMRALGLENGIANPGEAERLAQTLGVDGIVAGSVTAWDPYDPPTVGLALALYARPGSMTRRNETMLDPRALSRAYTDANFLKSNFAGDPTTVASEHLDARDHDTLLYLRKYAEGRSDHDSALGWRVHLMSMDLYTRFAAFQTVRRLLDEEWLRLAKESAERDDKKTP